MSRRVGSWRVVRGRMIGHGRNWLRRRDSVGRKKATRLSSKGQSGSLRRNLNRSRKAHNLDFVIWCIQGVLRHGVVSGIVHSTWKVAFVYLVIARDSSRFISSLSLRLRALQLEYISMCSGDHSLKSALDRSKLACPEIGCRATVSTRSAFMRPALSEQSS